MTSRERFLENVKSLAEYWAEQAKDKKQAAEGTAFSIMVLLDGCSDGIFELKDLETGEIITNGTRELHGDLFSSKKDT